ncbi:hypothetical protein JL475_00480 [Streptomyces sp. M2CJ-2]|uniref:hypothetical protein n=1 Tax=Streptomyces sp. M2CJ-2 TaxID=2803948 RepID=UPI00192361F1|nr:hypothetical protein [Streptomyces sp. M2CJ-2]MBL3664522.1 hypothetical protein [Streptomyces sp. M2CJ-2]
MPHGVMAEDRWNEFRDLHAEGLGRNMIARRMGITASVVSRTADHLGLTFDRSKIQAAADARKADVEERRSLLASQLLDIAEDSLARIYRPTTVYSFGGAKNEYNDHVFDEAPVAERVKLMTAAAIAVDKSLKLIPPGESSGADDAKSMLGKLAEGIAALAAQGDETPIDEGE